MVGRTAAGAAALLAAMAGGGCTNIASTLLVFFPGLGDKKPAEYALQGKKAVVAVTSTNEVALREAAAVQRIEEELIETLQRNVRRLEVVPARAVHDYRYRHQDQWGPGFMGRAGLHLGAEAVVEVWLERFDLTEAAPDEHVRQGRLAGALRVFESRQEGACVWEKPFDLRYPPHTVRLADDCSEEGFRQAMIDYLVNFVAVHFFEHRIESAL